MQRVSKREIEQALRALVPLSSAAQALIGIASDPNHKASELIRAIERDAHLTIRVIEIANSSAFAPSSPIETPACEPAIFTFRPLMAAIRMKSAARDRNAAKVDGNGMAPRLASPIAAPIITCSAMKHW